MSEHDDTPHAEARAGLAAAAGGVPDLAPEPDEDEETRAEP